MRSVLRAWKDEKMEESNSRQDNIFFQGLTVYVVVVAVKGPG